MRPLGAAALVATLVGCAPVDAAPPRYSRDELLAARPPRAEEPKPLPAPSVTAPPGAPRDFDEEVKLLFRVVACAGDAPIPSSLDRAAIDAYCRAEGEQIAAYRARWLNVAQPFLAKLVPQDSPPRVVYPFAGGDLVTALATYPAATDYTTLSLELAGDPRRLARLGPSELRESLAVLHAQLDELLGVESFSRSETLKRTQRGEIPGELAFFLVSLAIAGFEPVSLRYFRLEADGAIHYLDDAEIAALEDETAERRKSTWWPPDFSEAFADSEITFRRPGGSERFVHRHLAVNLSNDPLGASFVLPYLDRKGRVASMTKAASYLLWDDRFSRIRDWLAARSDVMISDSTGIPPAFAAAAGLTQETWGDFRLSLLAASPTHNEAFRKLWSAQPRRALPFRYGYLDHYKSSHLLVTTRAPR